MGHRNQQATVHHCSKPVVEKYQMWALQPSKEWTQIATVAGTVHPSGIRCRYCCNNHKRITIT
jgi:hypothetical protein